MIENLKTFYEGLKKCKNIGCNNIIYCYQTTWHNDYCDDDCLRNAQHFRSVNNTPYIIPRKKYNGEDIPTLYPHRWIDIAIYIPPDDWCDDINRMIEKLSSRLPLREGDTM